MQSRTLPPSRSSSQRSDEQRPSVLTLAWRQTQEMHQWSLMADAAEQDMVSESLRATLTSLRPHTFSTAGLTPLMHPPEGKNPLPSAHVAKRLDPQSSDSLVRICGEHSVRWQLRVVLNAVPAPESAEALRDALLRPHPLLFFQVGRPGPAYTGHLSDWLVDEYALDHEPIELFALAKVPSASRAAVAQLAITTADTPALLGQDGRLLRRPTLEDVYALLDPLTARYEAIGQESCLAPHFSFFAGIALLAQYDIATLDTKSFGDVWHFAPPFNLFESRPSKAFSQLIKQVCAREPTAYDKLHTKALSEALEHICRDFADLAVAYQH